MRTFGDRLLEFLFPAKSDTWLGLLRWGLGLQITLYCLASRIDWNPLYASNGNGLISRDLAEAILSVGGILVPRIGWVITAGEHLGLSEAIILNAAWTVLLCAGGCLCLGVFCRSSAIVAWFLHLCAVKSGELLSYGMDNFTTIGLFYLMIAPLPDRFSFDSRFRKLPGKNPQLQGFHRRVLQLHLCLIYFSGGITKCLGPGWWNGSSIWRALTRPPFNVISPELLASWGDVLPILGLFICLIELGYPFFIWFRKTRAIWLACVVLMHASIGFTMGLYLFSLIMIVLNVAAFGPDLRLFGRAKIASVQPPATENLAR